jgi:hypothetical protein
MSNTHIQRQLQELADLKDFEYQQLILTDAWLSSGIGAESIEPILQFMETHPDLDFGIPGALVHFVERFCGKGYETKLVESVLRRPTGHTVWMVNRLINGTKAPEERSRYIDVLERVRSNSDAEQDVKQRANHYLESLGY